MTALMFMFYGLPITITLTAGAINSLLRGYGGGNEVAFIDGAMLMSLMMLESHF